MCAKDDRILWSKRNKDFEYYLRRQNTPVDEDSHAYDCFNKYQKQVEGRVSASAWLDDYRVDQDAMIYEYAFYFPTTNSVYSVLWINEDIERHR